MRNIPKSSLRVKPEILPALIPPTGKSTAIEARGRYPMISERVLSPINIFVTRQKIVITRTPKSDYVIAFVAFGSSLFCNAFSISTESSNFSLKTLSVL